MTARRMRVGIRNEPAGATLGGSEYVIGCIAAMLSLEHDVEIISHTPALTVQSLSELCEADLGRVNVIHVEPQQSPFFPFRASWRQLREARDWQKELSAPYDLFINSTHGVPPFCHARYGILLLLFPFFDRFATWPWSARSDRSLRSRLRTWAYDREWEARFDSYQVRLANSRYTQQWTKRMWGIDCGVLYPPVDLPAEGLHDDSAERRDRIVSVGRFSVSGISKSQLELMHAFTEIAPMLPDGWQYESAGTVGADPADQDYVRRVTAAATASGRGRVLTNLTRTEVKSLYRTSKVFWHAMGYTATRPEQEEHFGIVTVESMAAGCVPVVVNRGGQPEIVEHGVSGFLWDTLDELRHYTVRLASDEDLRRRMSLAAQARAQRFARPVFLRAFERMVGELTS